MDKAITVEVITGSFKGRRGFVVGPSVQVPGMLKVSLFKLDKKGFSTGTLEDKPAFFSEKQLKQI